MRYLLLVFVAIFISSSLFLYSKFKDEREEGKKEYMLEEMKDADRRTKKAFDAEHDLNNGGLLDDDGYKRAQ